MKVTRHGFRQISLHLSMSEAKRMTDYASFAEVSVTDFIMGAVITYMDEYERRSTPNTNEPTGDQPNDNRGP